MPFDMLSSTVIPNVQNDVFKTRRLNAMAFLRSIVEPNQFDIRSFVHKNADGDRIGCAVSWLGHYQYDGWDATRFLKVPYRGKKLHVLTHKEYLNHAANYFGITREQAIFCFESSSYNDPASVTIDDVATRLMRC